MTGPAFGKLLLEGAYVKIRRNTSVETLEDAEVYIHVKGYALARVTHLDIEHGALNGLIAGKGGFFTVKGVDGGGVLIILDKNLRVEVRHPLLIKVITPGMITRTWVGQKQDGIYVGFRREQVRALEEIARQVYGIEPA
ncbi:MAG: hypothetical protein NXY59_08970 [Aigarchaeota archaeon]|nr:hypothetical protein [Candidatus Pelearchaeum maunauluense]